MIRDDQPAPTRWVERFYLVACRYRRERTGIAAVALGRLLDEARQDIAAWDAGQRQR